MSLIEINDGINVKVYFYSVKTIKLINKQKLSWHGRFKTNDSKNKAFI